MIPSFTTYFVIEILKLLDCTLSLFPRIRNGTLQTVLMHTHEKAHPVVHVQLHRNLVTFINLVISLKSYVPHAMFLILS